MIKFLLFCLIVAALLCAARYVPDLWYLVFPGVAVYSVMFYLDVKSTVRFGLCVVRRCETSPLFAYFSRHGFAAAISVQTVFEGMVGLLLPLLLVGRLSLAASGVVFAALGMVHFVGYVYNSKSDAK